MTPEKTLRVIEMYRRVLCARTLGRAEPATDHRPESKEARQLEHCLGMCDRMVEFVRCGQMEKAFRWLGFIQGVLWSQGIFDLDQLKEHNRPETGG